MEKVKEEENPPNDFSGLASKIYPLTKSDESLQHLAFSLFCLSFHSPRIISLRSSSKYSRKESISYFEFADFLSQLCHAN